VQIKKVIANNSQEVLAGKVFANKFLPENVLSENELTSQV
jgi:hypothetical protein